MTLHTAPSCPTCDTPLTYKTTDCTLAYGLGVIVSRAYQCPACHRWHHIEVTDTDEADRLVDALSNGELT
jgi:hypothetical protein